MKGKEVWSGYWEWIPNGKTCGAQPQQPCRDSSLGAGDNLHTQLQQLSREKWVRLYLFIYAVQHTQCFLKIHRDEKHSPRASKESFISGMTGTASLEAASECPALSTRSPPATQAMLEHARTPQGWSNPNFQGIIHRQKMDLNKV